MSFDEIMKEITSGLTGDNEKDIKYLDEQCEKYKNHKYSIEIIRACGRMIFDLISEDKKSEFIRLIDNDFKSIDAVIKEIHFNIFEKNYEKALKLSTALVEKAESNMSFENDTFSEYFTFDNAFEEILYKYHNESQKTIRHASVQYGEIFFIHGNLLFEHKRISEAREYLAKALRWNPASCTFAFEYIETFKVERKMADFYKLTVQQLKYAYLPKDVARCFRNLGYYYIEINEYSVAAACYYISLCYDGENTLAHSEMIYIERIAPNGYKKPTVELIEQYNKQYDLPIGADEDVVGLSYAYGQGAIKEGYLDMGIYFLDIYCNLTHDKKIIKQLEELKEKQ